jgi:hypothetical protein
MTFLNAWAVGFAAVAPVIVLLYLLKLKRRPVSVSTLQFWQRILQESRRRAFFQRLRQLFSLLLHLLIFALILGALLRPTFDEQVREGASAVLIVDTRARMQATEADGQTRFAKAQAAATGVVRQASALRQMAVISVSAGPSVVTPFTDDEKVLREGLAKIAVTDASGDLGEALSLAEELLVSRKGERRIIVFTDRAPGAKSAVLKTRVDFVYIGTARENLAITRLATRALLTSPETSEVLLEVANFGRAAAQTNVELSFDGRLLDVKPLTLAPGARSVQVFPTVPRPSINARGWLTARLDTTDDLTADNVAYAVLPVEPPRRVLLITKGNWFLEKLLAADQGLDFELLTPDAYTPALAAKFDAVLLDNFLPENFDLTNTPANFFFLKQTPFNTPGPGLEQPLLSDLDSQNPVLRLVNLQNVTFLRAASLALPGTEGWNWQAPIRSFEHPIMITGERLGSTQRLAALALDVTDSDLPLRVAFPLLISNTLHWLAGEEATPVLSRRAGETLSLATGESVVDQPQNPLKQASKPLPGATVRERFQPLTNGFYEIQARESSRWLAVNTFSEEDSDLRSTHTPATRAPALPMISLGQFASWPLWQYLAAAALALLVLEWWLFHRRRTE